MDAAVKLLKGQAGLIKKYWALASDEIQLFTSGDAVVGAAWPYQTNTLQAAKVAVADTIPSEGATGWADTWMISAKAAHPNCAYEWINWVTTPKVQAQQAIYFGETPANTLACKEMDSQQAGACAQYHANAPAAYFNQIKFWKTPRTQCGNGKTDCLDYTAWQREWQAIKG
jgi:putative spermidine/putrescine transport system substrate-binding protein